MRLDEELAAGRRNRTPVSLVLFDIDHFKRVNAESIYRLADQALYQAKKQGRNRVVIAR